MTSTHPWLAQVSNLINLRSGDTNEKMLEAGWCRGDIGRVADSFRTVAAFYYFAQSKPDAATPNAHRDCPFHSCSLSTPAVPRHASLDCNCPGMVAFPEDQLIQVYESGRIPCFSIGREEDGALAIVLVHIPLDEESQRDPENHFIALSHVWSEGMGNPQANALPLCQLVTANYWAKLAYQVVEESEQKRQSRLQQVIGDAERRRTVGIAAGIGDRVKPNIRRINLWIDTVCCPSTPGYGKNLCLARMREIYSSAYAVLVRSVTLDTMQLEEYTDNPAGGVVDVAAQLFLSPWMRRMWTFQEGILAGIMHGRGYGDRLCLKFAGSVTTLSSLVTLLGQAPRREAAVAFEIRGQLAQLSSGAWQFIERKLPRDGNEDGNVGAFLEILSRSLKFRSVSVASDEVVCLATLLGLHIAPSHGAVPLIGDGKTPESGMREL
jgi:hypothetical protein